MANALTPFAFVVLLVLSIGSLAPKGEGQCGYNNCTNFFQTCSTPEEPARCICVPMGGVYGTCIYQGLIKENLNYCLSHSDCVQKGQGDFCIKASSAGTEFGWCLSRDDANFLKLPA